MNIYRAFDFSKYLGFPLNTYVMINLIYGDQFLKRYIFNNLRKKVNRWIKREYNKRNMPEVKPIWVYVFENPNNNFHVHWLLYIHKNIQDDFNEYVKKQLLKLQIMDLKPNQLDIRSVNPYTDKILANYLCKGTRHDYIDFFHLQNYATPQGYIEKQRTRVSQALGKTARKNACFDAKTMRHLWEEMHPQVAYGFDKPSGWDLNEIVPQLMGTKTFPDHKSYWNSHCYSAFQLPIDQLVILNQRIKSNSGNRSIPLSHPVV